MAAFSTAQSGNNIFGDSLNEVNNSKGDQSPPHGYGF
jgi:hypothetical protein